MCVLTTDAFETRNEVKARGEPDLDSDLVAGPDDTARALGLTKRKTMRSCHRFGFKPNKHVYTPRVSPGTRKGVDPKHIHMTASESVGKDNITTTNSNTSRCC